MFVMAALSATVVSAADPDVPSVLAEAHGFQCLIDCGAAESDKDMLVLVRYELDKESWRNATYMEEITCLDNDETLLLDLCWTSLFSGAIAHTFYDGAKGSGALIRGRTPPRVGHGFSALYIPAGHSLSFSDPTYETCIEPSTTLFTPAAAQCFTLTWHPVTDELGNGDLTLDVLDGHVVNSVALADVVNNFEGAIPGRTAYFIVNNFITPIGAVYTNEAYINWPRAAPGAFAISSGVNADVSLATADSAAETAIATEAASSRLYGWISDWQANHMPGMSVTTVGTLLMTTIAIIAAVIVLMYLKSAFIALTVAGLIILFGSLQNLVEMSLILTVLLLVIGYGSFKLVRQLF